MLSSRAASDWRGPQRRNRPLRRDSAFERRAALIALAIA